MFTSHSTHKFQSYFLKNFEISRMSEKSSPVKSFIAGGAGGMAAVIVGQPFDMVKVQLQNSSQYKGSLDCATVSNFKSSEKNWNAK